MDIVGIGVDLVDVERVARILERRKTFVERVFTPPEIEYCERQANPAESYAARWAAREACRKAAKARADSLDVSEVKVALTHERRMAAAFCVAVRG